MGNFRILWLDVISNVTVWDPRRDLGYVKENVAHLETRNFFMVILSFSGLVTSASVLFKWKRFASSGDVTHYPKFELIQSKIGFKSRKFFFYLWNNFVFLKSTSVIFFSQVAVMTYYVIFILENVSLFYLFSRIVSTRVSIFVFAKVSWYANRNQG